MAASINASTTAGVVTTADTSGVLNIQTANTTAISISASQVVSYTNNPTYSGGTANGVLYLNGSKVATSGSALVFDGTNLGLGVTPSAGYRASIKGNYSSIVGGIEFDNGGGDKTVIGFASATSPSFIISNQSAAGVLRFDTNNTERARIDSSGNLLVGTTSSTVWNGAAGTKVVVGGSGNTITSLQSSTTTVDQGAIFEGYATGISSNSAALGSIAFLRSNTSTTALSSYTAFYTNNAGTVAERARIDSSGRLLVGTITASGTNRLLVDAANSGSDVIRAQNTGGTGARIASFADGSSTIGSGPNFYMQNVTGPNTWAASMQMGASAEIIFFQYPNSSWSERARIDSSGNLLVGATSSDARLYVKGSGSTSSTFSLIVRNSAGGDLVKTRDDGYIYLPSTYNNTSASAANIFMGGSGELYRSTSSLKYKTNVQDAVHGLSDLLKLRSVTYEGKSETDAGKTFGGLIAEEVHDAGLTEFVQYAEDGSPDALAYGNMVSLCIKAIQEQQALIQTLTARIEALEGAK